MGPVLFTSSRPISDKQSIMGVAGTATPEVFGLG